MDIPLIPKINIFTNPHFTFPNPTLARTLVSLVILLGTGTAFADDAQDDQPPWYEVEAIIFTNKEQLGLNSETWPEVAKDLQYDKVIDLRLPDDPSVLAEQKQLKPVLPRLPPVTGGAQTKPQAPEPSQPAEVPFVMLGSSTFQLKSIDQRLRKSGKYNVLLHLCWRQPTLPRDKSIPVYVYSGMTQHSSPASGTIDGPMGPNYPELFGTLRLSVSRYLHMQTDLHLRVPFMMKEEVPVADNQASGGFGSFFGVNQSAQPQTRVQEHEELTDFPLQESRRLRSTEIHYFDNPMFGMILTVRPYGVNPQPQ